MRKRLPHILSAVTLVAAFFVALTLPAAAEPKTVTVQLPNGQIVEVTVDVPEGTPIEDIPGLPGIPVPPGTQPAPQGDPSSPPPEDQPSADRDEPSDKDRKRSKKDKEAEEDETPAEEIQELIPQAEVQARRKKQRSQRRAGKPPLRKKDGSPTRTNPTFVDALPGPSQITGVPNFVIRKFKVPLFLLPIYQAAGIQYGIRWEVLAAINEIETDYGRNLNVSTAGAVGWMQFLPSTFRAYGVDGNKDGQKDPYNPVDAIFSAARYLKAAGGEKDIKKAIFAYNHADWYVDSVVLRARLIAGVPGDLVGSLTGLTEGRFPVYARSRYADDISEREAKKRFRRGQNAARVVEGDDNRRAIEIFSREKAPVIAVNDGVIKRIGNSKRIGRYIVLQDVYGNRYTYGGLHSVRAYYPVPKDEPGESERDGAKALTARRDPAPTKPASAGRQSDGASAAASAPRRVESEDSGSPRPSVAVKPRLFANPSRPNAKRAGGLEQILDSPGAVTGYTTFRKYFSRAFGLNAKDAKLKRLRPGSRVIGGTILGRIGQADAKKAPNLHFEIRPAGRGAPRVDPKPILDGWKLLESTAIYRASGRSALHGDDKDNFSIGQVLLLPKPLLERRVLADERIEIYECGRRDVRGGQIDRRVLATLAYLAEAGLRPTVTSLKCGHGFYTASGNVSHHSSGNAVDIARINGVPILGHQEEGGITEQTVRRLMRLQGTLAADQIISLLDLGGNTYAMGDHADHIHVGFRPLFGANRKQGRQALAILKPGQWDDLLSRLREIDNPVVPRKVSKFAIPVRKHRASEAHRGE